MTQELISKRDRSDRVNLYLAIEDTDMRSVVKNTNSDIKDLITKGHDSKEFFKRFFGTLNSEFKMIYARYGTYGDLSPSFLKLKKPRMTRVFTSSTYMKFYHFNDVQRKRMLDMHSLILKTKNYSESNLMRMSASEGLSVSSVYKAKQSIIDLQSIGAIKVIEGAGKARNLKILKKVIEE